MNRREFIAAGVVGAVAGANLTASPKATAQEKRFQGRRSPWPICLDTATIRPATLKDKVRIATEAGYDAIEPWDGELREYEANGGSLDDLGKEIADRGLFVPSMIGLWNAIPPTQDAWEAGLPEMRNRMRMAAAVGAQHVQVIPQPARPWREFDPAWAAAKYREILEMGLNDYNLNPALVFVQFLEGSKRLGQAAAIAIDADHPKAKIIPDVFHMYIGDSGFNGLKHIQGDLIAIFQFNDAPASPAKEEQKDEHRVYPGDGILPLESCLRDLHDIGYTGSVSLELYNPTYWEQDHLQVAKTGLEKTVRVIEKALI
jgi:2-keto-myo-inositol isomerase